MRSETLIVEDVMLMLLDDETGVEAGAGTLHYTLGSAVLVELALLGRIDIDEGRAGLNGPEVLAVLGDLYDAGTEAWEPAGVLDACERTLNAVGGVVSTVDPDLFDRPTPCRRLGRSHPAQPPGLGEPGVVRPGQRRTSPRRHRRSPGRGPHRGVPLRRAGRFPSPRHARPGTDPHRVDGSSSS